MKSAAAAAPLAALAAAAQLAEWAAAAFHCNRAAVAVHIQAAVHMLACHQDTAVPYMPYPHILPGTNR